MIGVRDGGLGGRGATCLGGLESRTHVVAAARSVREKALWDLKSLGDLADEWRSGWTSSGRRIHSEDVADMMQDTTQEQQMRYKSLAASQLTQALLSLWATEKLCHMCAGNKDAVSALIRDALTLYGSAFKYGEFSNGGLSEESHVPKRFGAVHRDLIAYRDSFFAHFDSDLIPDTTAAQENKLSWHGDAKGPSDFEDEIPRIKALILEILSEKLWPELLNEHEELAEEYGL